jgi:hypothetical protein
MDEAAPERGQAGTPKPTEADGAPPPRPRLIMSRPEGRGPGNAWWVILVLLVLAALAATAVWYFAFRGDDEATPTPAPSPTPSQVGWAGAWVRSDGAGGGVMVEGSSGAYRVTAYDAALQPSETVDAVPGDGGRELRFTLPAQFSLGDLAGPLEAVLRAGQDPDSATLSVTSAGGATASAPLARVPSLQPSSPASSPRPPSGPTSSASPTPSPGDGGQSLTLQMIDAIERIQAGIEAWSRANDGTYPLPADVRAGASVARYADPWPMNPYAPDLVMAPGTEPGDFTYQVLDGGLGYELTGYLDNGAFVVP